MKILNYYILCEKALFRLWQRMTEPTLNCKSKSHKQNSWSFLLSLLRYAAMARETGGGSECFAL